MNALNTLAHPNVFNNNTPKWNQKISDYIKSGTDNLTSCHDSSVTKLIMVICFVLNSVQ